jgi:hypothetical protein
MSTISSTISNDIEIESDGNTQIPMPDQYNINVSVCQCDMNDAINNASVGIKRCLSSNMFINKEKMCWRLPMPETLLKSNVVLWNPLGDGNCLFRALLGCTNSLDTMDDCYRLRKEITDYMR